MKIIEKTNVARILEASKINYKLLNYEVDDGLIDAVSVAKKINVDCDRVFKTLVTCGKNNGINVFVIPGNCELNLKKAAIAANDKKIEMLKSKELYPKTGYVHGGCSPVGMKKLFPTFIEEIALEYDYIVVSAGKIGVQILINPSDLEGLTDAVFADLV